MSLPASSPTNPYDALLLVAFGGPEKMEDVLPFLENVLRGKNVPRERLLEVAHHYELFDGVSPINQQMRELLAALKPELQQNGIDIPVYWGNRNWHPLLTDTLQEMRQNGVQRTLALMVSAYSSYSGCRQYREDLQKSCQTLQAEELHFDKVRVFYNHPLFISASADRLQEALDQFDEIDQPTCQILFTAHSLPLSMSESSHYVRQLEETCRLVTEQLDIPADRWKLVYQSRSGRPQDPWLEPDILDELQTQYDLKRQNLIIDPLGFLSDHMEVLYDLDVEARQFCDEHGQKMIRAKTVGTHPDFLKMLAELVQERLHPESAERRSIGKYGPSHDICPLNCCPAPQRPTQRQS